MSSAITIAGQTKINQLRGAELPLIIDRMVLALIPGFDPTLAVDRSQQMPEPGNIVHTAIIDSAHKGYVDPDQVVYSIVLGSDVGDFSFNWIGLIEAVTDTVIAITTTPETPKRKTNLANNTTGNNITRNFMIQFLDAQNLTGVTVAAETWQFDYLAEFSDHEALVVDPAQAGTVGKHVTNSQAKVWQDHVASPHYFSPVGVIMPFIGGYFTNGNNGGFVSILGNTVAEVNSVVSAEGYRVCDGSTFSDPRSPIFNVAGRYLPNLTDDRFLMGDTVAGVSGGDNVMGHTHTMSHTHTIAHTHTTASLTLTEAQMPYHAHVVNGGGVTGGGSSYFGFWQTYLSQVVTSYAGGNQAHNHGNTGGSSAANSGAASNETTSGASVTENRPKFLSCLYIMKVF